MIAVCAKRIYTGEEILEGGHLLIEGGKIVDVGDGDIPEGAEVISFGDANIFPGFIDPHCHIGIMEEIIGAAGSDENERSNPVTPYLRAIDAINPMDESFEKALEKGVTTVVTGPGSANVMGGSFLAMKTWGRCVDKMVLKDPVAQKIAFGENPRKVYGMNRDTMPKTRMAVAWLIRKALFDAMEYKRRRDLAVGKAPLDPTLEPLVAVLEKKIPLKAHAHRADDIFTALRIAREFDVNITLDHCTEAHLIWEELKEAQVPIILGPTFGTKSKFELKEKGFHTLVRMAEEGIAFAMMTDHPVLPCESLPHMAGLAVAEGVSEEVALRAITIEAARAVGIADRVGSLEVGKDADLCIYDKNPLREMDARCLATIIDGEFRHRKET